MCGLVGIAGALEYKDEDVIQRMLHAGYWRGKESTGMAAIRKNDEVLIAKLHSHAIDLFDMGRFKVALSGHQSKAFIGHNRAATSGKVNLFNAHPFHYDQIVGAHNGTLPLNVHRQLESVVGEAFPVDSMALLACIAKIGIKETIEQIKGAWALVWFNTANNTINFLRNDARPLWYAWSEDCKKIYWASEFKTIDGSVSGAGLKVWKNKEGGAFFPVPANQHFMLSIDKLIVGGKSPPKFKMKKIEESKEPEPAYSIPNRGVNSPGIVRDAFGRDVPWSEEDEWAEWSNYAHGGEERKVLPFLPGAAGGHQKTNERTGSGSNNGRASTNHSNIGFLNGSAKEPFAGRLSRRQFEDIAISGCQWCGRDVHWGDTGIAVYEKEGLVLCKDHAPNGNEHGNRLYVTGAVNA